MKAETGVLQRTETILQGRLKDPALYARARARACVCVCVCVCVWQLGVCLRAVGPELFCNSLRMYDAAEKKRAGSEAGSAQSRLEAVSAGCCCGSLGVWGFVVRGKACWMQVSEATAALNEVQGKDGVWGFNARGS